MSVTSFLFPEMGEVQENLTDLSGVSQFSCSYYGLWHLILYWIADLVAACDKFDSIRCKLTTVRQPCNSQEFKTAGFLLHR